MSRYSWEVLIGLPYHQIQISTDRLLGGEEGGMMEGRLDLHTSWTEAHTHPAAASAVADYYY